VMATTLSDASTMTTECEFEVLEQVLDEAKLAAVVAALLEGGGSDNDPQCSLLVLGEKQDWVLRSIVDGVVSIASTCDPKKFVTLHDDQSMGEFHQLLRANRRGGERAQLQDATSGISCAHR